MSHRIVSLIASGTEIVTALGFGEQLVGRSHECDYPEWVAKLPACSEPRIDVHADSQRIDDQVRGAVRDGLSVYKVFVEELDRLAPTHIITQSQCEVCAVSLADVRQAVCELVSSQPEIISLEPMDLRDVWSDVQRVATSLGAPERGRQLVAGLRRRLEELAAQVPASARRPELVCLEWLSPLMSAGNWVPELVEIAGGAPLLCKAGEHSPCFDWEDLLAADPDVIAIMPCGFDFPRLLGEMHFLTDHPRWPELRAVREGRVYLTDGNQFFNRPGPRVVESAEILFEILHPELRDARPWRHQETGWRRLSPCQLSAR